MPRFVDPETGERFENDAPDAAEQARANDLVLESDYEYDQKPFLSKAAETIRATGDAASRMMNPVNKLLLGDDVPDVATSQADREIAQRHPYAGMVGQAVMAAPLLPLGGVPALVAESALGGTVTEAENAWLEDRDFSKESAFMNVGAGLLVGGALWGGIAGAQSLTRYGRNLLTEAEHAAGARAARELTERAAAKEGSKALSAADIAAMDPSDHAIAYLRENADELMDELSTKQAKAAQDLLDSYGQTSKLKTPKKELAALIPEANKLDQSRWVVSARQQAYDLLETVPEGVGRPLQERLAKLDEGASPVAWFQRSSDVSDELMSIRARAAADPAVQASLDTLDRVQQIFSDGLGNPSIWGKAAERETQRASGYARRLQEHLADFESQFTSKVGKRNLADPSKFRAHLRADSVDGALRQRAVDATLDAARATAEQAQKFGKPEQAKKILDAVQAMDDLQRQGGALKAAQRSAVVEPKADRSAGALAWLGNQAKQRAGSAIGGVAGSMVGGGPIGGLVGAGVGEAAQRGIESLAKRFTSKLASRAGEGGAAAVAPLGIATGAGAAGLGAHKAYQMALDDHDPAAERAGVFRAVGAFRRNADDAGKRGADDLLRTQPQGAQTQGARNGVSIAAPTGPGPVTALNYDAVRGHIDKMANDPRYFAEVMGASFGRLPEVAPEVYSALSEQSARAANYLAAVAPGGESGGPFSDVVPVSDDELWDFNQRLSAISDPDFVRDELRQGSLTSQAIEAYQAVHERSYVKLQIHVFERLQQLKADGIPVPSQAREQLDVLLDLDGGGDPALTWQVAERAAAAEQAHKSRLAMKPKAPGDSGAMTSGALASLQNGAAAVAQTG